jgi:hypothetical protein
MTAALQNVQFWEASVSAGLEPTSAQIGGNVRYRNGTVTTLW